MQKPRQRPWTTLLRRGGSIPSPGSTPQGDRPAESLIKAAKCPGIPGIYPGPQPQEAGAGGYKTGGWVFSYGRPENFKTESSGSGGLGTVPGDLGQDWGAGEGRAWERNRAVLPQMPGFTPGGSKARALEAGYRELLGSWPLFVFLEVERGAPKTKSAHRRNQAGSR